MGSIVNRGTKDRPKWYCCYKDETGRWRMKNTKQETKASAAKYLATVEARVANGLVGIEAHTKERTFGDLATYWLENHSQTELVSHDDNVGRMKHLTKVFGRMPVSQITPTRIDEFKARMQREKWRDEPSCLPRWAPATINRTLALLRKVLNDGVRWNWIKAAPKVRLIKVPEQAYSYLKREEAESLLTWAKGHAPNDFALYATAIFTGMRMGELYGLKWEDVDLARGQVSVQRSDDQPHTKSKRIRRIEIPPVLLPILKAWSEDCPKGDVGLAFPTVDGDRRPREKPPLGWRAHLAGAKVRSVKFHDLRHTAASLMIMTGISLRTVQQILGHSTITVTERYAHLAPDFMKREVERFSLTIGA